MARQRQGAQAAGGASGRKRTAHSQFLPRRPILLITDAGPIEIPSDQVSFNQVGRKALGLSALPIEWTPPFFVVSAQCFDRQIPLETVNDWISVSQTRLAFVLGAPLMIRSSGTTETIRDRGSLISKLCTSKDVAASVEQLRAKIRSEEHTSELQSPMYLVCRLLLEKKK